MNRSLAAFALSVGGYGFAAIILYIAWTGNIFDWTGDVGRLFDPVGDALRAGRPIYAGGPGADPFFYAPPWAVAFAAVSWLPIEVMYGAIIGVNILGLRYMAGSWLRVGWLAWFPLVPIALNTGNFNLLLAAAIVAGVRGHTGLPVVLGLAKLSPFITLDPRRWRSIVPLAVVLVAVTLPWLSLWPQWIEQIIRYAGQSLGPQVPIPFIVRAPIAAGLLLFRRPVTTATAAVVAIPSFYWESFVVFLAPLCVWLRSRAVEGEGERGVVGVGAESPHDLESRGGVLRDRWARVIGR